MRQIPYIVERPFTFSTERPRAAYQELSQRIKNAKLAVDILKRVDFSSFTDQLERYGEVKTEFRMLRHKRLEQRRLEVVKRRQDPTNSNNQNSTAKMI